MALRFPIRSMRALPFALLVLVALVPRAAQANTAPALWLGERHGVVVPQRSTNVRIDDERLTFRIEPDSADAQVTAVYRMTAAAAENVEMAFAFVRPTGGYPTLTSVEASVAIDGTEVEYRLKTDGELLEPALHAWLDARPDFARGAPCRASGCPSLMQW